MADIYIYDVIGRGFMSDGATAEKLRDELAEIPKGEAITVRINSPGGDVFEGLAMRTLLADRGDDVTIKVDGVAASAASVVALAGSRVEMAEGSMLMIHDPWTLTVGNEADHLKTAETLGKVSDNLADLYAARSGKTTKETRKAMQAETWFTAHEAIDYGLADAVSDSKAAAFAVPDVFGYRNAPQATATAERPGWRLEADARRRQIDLTRARLMS